MPFYHFVHIVAVDLHDVILVGFPFPVAETQLHGNLDALIALGVDLQAERATLRLRLDAVVTDGVFRPAEFLIVIIAVADDGTVLIIDVVGKGVHHMIDHLRLTDHEILRHDLTGHPSPAPVVKNVASVSRATGFFSAANTVTLPNNRVTASNTDNSFFIIKTS